MSIFKRILDFYLQASFHVALSCWSLVKLTQCWFHLPDDKAVSGFAFFGTIVGYNFVKYDALVRTQKRPPQSKHLLIAGLSFMAVLGAVYCFWHLHAFTQLLSLLVLLLTVLYTLPFFPNRKNARNWAGIKIYIVTICWLGVTLFLPVINAQMPIDSAFYLFAAQRILLIFSLVLIFEIVDLKTDDPHLQTVPQQIGVQATRRLGWLLMAIFVFIELVWPHQLWQISLVKFGLAATVALMLWQANANQSRYFSWFWAESIPVVWWAAVWFLSR
ncbi:hypothetical protein KIH23_04370 [Flavobacterium sp. CYK-55]|uniref:hypothetical protein n=1 Tax=Flavobacterium sp. CYK-55 TaxID=2835529 RepID=UPI001BCE40C4|nr:hypothetical protein [Flavobacterium sp. CYK-55]MBS7786524.1 hypothetical protein [Flavobacterium sp. CYK-55]